MAEPVEAVAQPAGPVPGLQVEPLPSSSGNAAAGPKPTSGGRVGGFIRAALAVVLIVLGVLSLTLSPVTIWGRNLLLNTDRYVQTVAPLASNPGVQTVIVNQIDEQVEAHLDVQAYVKQALPPRAAALLAAPLQSAVYGLIHTAATRVVQSKAFYTLWVAINRVAHKQIVTVLTGRRVPGEVIVIRQGKIYLDISSLVKRVKDQLVVSGITVASKLPVVGATVQIAEVKGLEQTQSGVRALNTIADWLPWIGLALVALGILAARRHRRALIASALGLCVGMIIVGVLLLVLRHAYVSGVPDDIAPPQTSSYVFDTIVRYLRWGIRIVFVVALLVALGVWVGGPATQAVAIRRWVSNETRRLGGRLPAGPVSTFVARYVNPLRIGVVGVGGIILLLIEPSAGAIILLAVIVILLLLALEVLRAPVGRAPAK
jgi:hypothetical protein